MNKRITFISSALVALLASCGNKSAQGQLKECTSATAAYTAASILAYREAKHSTLIGDDMGNPFYSEYLALPVEAKKLNTEVTMKSYENEEGNTDENIVIKTFNVDLEKGVINCKIRQTRETNYGVKYNYPNIDYYAFFNEYEKQDEDNQDIWAHKGDAYLLVNVDGQSKIGLRQANWTRSELYEFFREFLLVGAESISSGILTMPQLANIMYYPSFIAEDIWAYTSESYSWYNFTSSDSLTLYTLLENFGYFTNALSVTAEGLKEEFNRDDTYLNVRYGSDDLESLSFDIDYNKYLKDYLYTTGYIEGNASEQISVTFRNQFITETHYTYKVHASSISMEPESATTIPLDMDQNIQVDQKVNYGSCSCSVPTDIDQYLLFFPN